jgi:hypothetical protein
MVRLFSGVDVPDLSWFEAMPVLTLLVMLVGVVTRRIRIPGATGRSVAAAPLPVVRGCAGNTAPRSGARWRRLDVNELVRAPVGPAPAVDDAGPSGPGDPVEGPDGTAAGPVAGRRSAGRGGGHATARWAVRNDPAAGLSAAGASRADRIWPVANSRCHGRR